MFILCNTSHYNFYNSSRRQVLLSTRWDLFGHIYVSDSLTYWGQVTHIYVGKLTIIGSDNGLWPERRQAIIWTNAGILLIWPLRTNFNEILIEIYIYSFKQMHLKMSSGNWRPFYLGLNVLYGLSGWFGAENDPKWVPFASCGVYSQSDCRKIMGLQPRKQGSWGQHGAHLGPVGPRWAPCRPHEPC